MAASKAQRAAAAEKTANAIRLRIAGMDWEEIAKQLGYASRGAACTAVTRAYERHVAAEGQALEVLRAQEIDRLNRLQRGLWAAATTPTRTPDGILSPPDPQAAEVVRKIIVDRCKILGLSAPAKHELLTLDAMDAEIARLNQVLGDMPADADT